ncbi:MAG: hypothetical protein IKZ95_06120 [Lachnospiraceae bacterium]|nr:hypothetical protein [Lachnospiraceae bacterium]
MALQVCGRQSNNPYYIKAIDQNVYSLEEINYFIYNHINLVYRDFFSDTLFEYIDIELGHKELAKKLRELADYDASIQDFIKCILNESYYYSGHELSRIANAVMNIDNMTEAERIKIEGDAYYKAGRLEAALNVYFDLLNNMDTNVMPEAFYGRVAYAIGVIYAKMFMSRNANSYFARAYEIYPDPSYARSCVYMSLVNNDEEELLKTIVRYHISDDTLERIRKRVGALRREIETSDATLLFIRTFENGNNSKNIIDDWKKDYHERIS